MRSDRDLGNGLNQVNAATSPNDPFRLEIHLFGGPRLLAGGKAIKLSKYQSYLTALVFGHGEEGVSRSRVIEFLWDEPDGLRQRHRLSQLLYTLNSKTDQKIVQDDGGFLVGAGNGSCDLRQIPSLSPHSDRPWFSQSQE